jgi:hypothetical protein
MRVMLPAALSVTLLFLPGAVRSQEQSVSSPATAAPSTYANTSQGLKQFLEDIRTAAKRGDGDKVDAFVKGMEIPDCDAWLHKMYDSDKADSWMGLCEAKVLGPKENSMRELCSKPSSNRSISIGQVGCPPANLKSPRLTQLVISCS